jgi:NAD(P)H-flavin reductase
MQLTTEVKDPMLPQCIEISEVRRNTHDTYTLTAKAHIDEPFPAYLPGQFSMIYEYGVGEVPISISGDCEIRDRLTYTIRDVGPTTEAIVKHKPGDYIGIRGSYGTSWPVECARGRDVLIVAGGIGLAPLRPVIQYVIRHRSDYGRLILLYGARTPDDLLYRKQLRQWGRAPQSKVMVTVDRALEKWHGHVGVVTRLFDLVSLDPAGTIAMTCGPEIMMQFVVRELLTRKFAAADIYLSLERSMKCGIGLCGHCQMGPYFICKDGPVFAYSQLSKWMENRHEL